MRRGTLFRRYELFVAAACIAAHANTGSDGFRQRDLRFLIELFTNWVDHSLDLAGVGINNTQVLRYLEQLVADGYARVSTRGGRPTYRLSRTGVIELLMRIVPGSTYLQPEQFAFVYYFIKNYRSRLIAVIEAEGRQFPMALRLEVDALLEIKSLVQNQLRSAELELQKLESRIRDSEQGARLAQRLFREGKTTEQVAAEVEKLYPYELNSLKPLSELMSEVPPDLARWELETGAQRRVEDLWGPVKAVLAAHVRSVKQILD